jgi:hypothetical protein
MGTSAETDSPDADFASKWSLMWMGASSLRFGNVDWLVNIPGAPGVKAPERFPFPVTTVTTSAVVETRIAIGPFALS